jgi:hypothetical protein
MPSPTHGFTDSKVLSQFDKDLKDLHLMYNYDAEDEIAIRRNGTMRCKLSYFSLLIFKVTVIT